MFYRCNNQIVNIIMCIFGHSSNQCKISHSKHHLAPVVVILCAVVCSHKNRTKQIKQKSRLKSSKMIEAIGH